MTIPLHGRTEGRRIPLSAIPLAYIAASIIAGYIFPRVENTYWPSQEHSVSVQAAIGFLSAITSGMMALTGIVFGIGLVLVQFSTVAYSPRFTVIVASNPMLFHALGLFIATFIYSVVTLLWTDRNGSGTVPVVSAWFVITLVALSMFAFARTLQLIADLTMSAVVQGMGDQGRAQIAKIFVPFEAQTTDAQRPVGEGHQIMSEPTQMGVYAGKPTYIALVDTEALFGLAVAANAVIVVSAGIGDNIDEGFELLRVYGGTSPLEPRALNRAFVMRKARTISGNPKHAVRILVDIAIRALSPAVNDPTTAVEVVDEIEDLLRRIGRSHLPSGAMYDEDGALRLSFPTPTWEDYLELSFDEIRQYGIGSEQVLRRLRAALDALARAVATEERRNSLLQYLDHLETQISSAGFDSRDRLTASEADRQGLGLSKGRTRV